jgi:hypothetical protein
MIDLEEALAPLVERAPAPPAVESVARRGRARRHRRTAALGTALFVIGAFAIVSIATIANRDAPRVAGPQGEIEHLRVTLLDGSQLDISAPKALRLRELSMSFNAQLSVPRYRGMPPAPGNSFTVIPGPRPRTGQFTAVYMTADNQHTLRIYGSEDGYEGVVQYDGWSLFTDWNEYRPTDWKVFADALTARVTSDGYLVVTPAAPGWRVGPTDAADLQLGEYLFYGPAHNRCRAEILTRHERCNADGSTTYVFDLALANTLADIDVTYTPPPTP